MISKNEIRKKYLQMLHELSRHLRSPKYRSLQLERAFIQWFIFARFGITAPNITDGARDGGIDAIIDKDGRTFVFQMKYETQPRISNVTRNEIAAFENVARQFKYFNQEEYNKWIQTVRPELRDYYNRIKDNVRVNPDSVRFVFVTSKKCTYPSLLVDIADVDDVLSLWDLYNTDLTPPVESIQLLLENAFNIQSKEGEFTTYVGLADVREFRKVMRNDKNDRVFARNVRTYLQTDVNKAIRETYEKDPEKFWLGNNGIYIICKKVTAEGRVYTLQYPSIINGSQSLHSISQSSKEHSCKILVRILQMDISSDQRLLAEVIRRTNSQNTMKVVNLLAHDPFQINVARYLNQYKIFYERREREWQNEKKSILNDYLSISVKEVAQWLSTLHVEIGFGTARGRPNDLLQEKFYPTLFEVFDSDFRSQEYNNLIYTVWSGLFFKDFLKKLPNKKKVPFKFAQLIFVKMLCQSIQINPKLQALIKDKMSNHIVGRKKIPAKIISLLQEVMQNIKKVQKRWNKRDSNIDFTNFFKRNDSTADAYKVACSKNLKHLSLLIEKNIKEIR